MLSLTPGEKLIAFMLADLMQHLEVQSEIDPKTLRNLLTANDEWALEHLYEGLLTGRPPDPDVIRETGEILDMFRALDHAIDRLSDDEKAELDVSRLRFEGFDGNNNPHLHVARVMIDELGWFDERKPLPNSHSQASLIRYRRMLPKFHAEVERAAFASLSLDQLKSIAS